MIRVGVQLGLFFLLADSLSAAGLTAGNGISYLASAIISLAVLRRRIGYLGLRSVAISLAKVLLAAAAAAALGLLVVHLLPGGGTPDKLAAIMQLVVGATVILLTYVGAAALLRVPEVGQVIGMVRRRIGR
jgi:putative peptidoglycan lipid II flippase